MTRSVTIVNTSNWEHEDYIVRRRRSDFDGGTGLPDDTRLQPGDVMQFTPGRESISILPVEEQTPVPFRDADGNQDWPRVEVHQPKGSDE